MSGVISGERKPYLGHVGPTSEGGAVEVLGQAGQFRFSRHFIERSVVCNENIPIR